MDAGNLGALPASTGFRSSSRTGGPNIIYGKRKHGQIPFQYQQFTPEQMNLFQQMFGHVGPESFLGKLAGGDESAFSSFEEPAWRNFQGMVGNLADRFSGKGARRSSNFQNLSTQMGSDFATKLQQQRFNMQNKAIQDLFNMSNQLMSQRPYQQGILSKPKKPSFWQKILGGLGGTGLEALPWESLLGVV